MQIPVFILVLQVFFVIDGRALPMIIQQKSLHSTATGVTLSAGLRNVITFTCPSLEDAGVILIQIV